MSVAKHVTARLKELRERAGLTMDAIALELGYKGGSSYQRYESPTDFKKDFLPSDLVLKLADILPGRGNPKITRQEVYSLHRATPDELGELIADAFTAHIGNTPDIPGTFERNPDMIPEVDMRAGMGGGALEFQELSTEDEHGNRVSADVVVAEWSLPERYLRTTLNVNPKDAWVMEVIGDSMSPTLYSGDKVLIDTSYKSPSPEGLYALHDGMSIVVKRLEHEKRGDDVIVRIISDNPLHARIEERTAEEVNIIGRVAWFARRM